MTPTFADMVETLRRLVKRDSDRLLRERGHGPDIIRDNRIEIVRGAREWTIERRTQFGATPLFAVDLDTRIVTPITSDPSSPAHASRRVPLAEVRHYDWRLAPQLRADVDPMPWASASAAPVTGKRPKRTGAREPTMRTASVGEDYGSTWQPDPTFDPSSTINSDPITGNWVGKSFRSSDSDRDILAAVRRDIAAAIRMGALPPGMKVSVRQPAPGRNMRVLVTEVPGVWLIDPETARVEQWTKPTEARSAITRRLVSIVMNYGYSRRTPGVDYEPRSLTDRMPFDVRYDDALIAQQSRDAHGVEAGEREDMRLAQSITKALKLPLTSAFVVGAVILGPSHWRLEWRTSPRYAKARYGAKPPPVLFAQDVTSPGEALEFARAWHRETKTNR